MNDNIVQFPFDRPDSSPNLRENYSVCDIFIGATIAQTIAHDYHAAEELRSLANISGRKGLVRVLVPASLRKIADKYANILSEQGRAYREQYLNLSFGRNKGK